MPTLVFKTHNGNVRLSLPKIIDTLPLNQSTTWFKDTSAADVIAHAESLKMDITTGTYWANYPFFYINSNVISKATASFDLVDLIDYNDYSIFQDPWECNDLRIRWTQPVGNNGVVNGYLADSQGDIFTNQVYQFYLTPTSQQNEVNMQISLAYYEPDDQIVCLGGLTFLNQFRINSDSNGFWYKQYRNYTSFSGTEFTRLTNALNGHSTGGGGGIEPDPSDDPYSPDGPSGGGPASGGGSGGGYNPSGTGTTGNGGLFDDSSDDVPIPSLPSSITTGSGLFRAYNPDSGQLASFANSLWSTSYSSFDELFKILFGGDAFNAIIGLHLLPVQPTTGSSASIKLGNWDSGVSAPVITNQYKQVNFGSVLLAEYWGNSIDYSPYTKVQLALPYIGIVDVDTDDVIGSNNTLTYNIDVLSGAITAILHCAKGNLNSVIYQWSGSCAVALPISGANYNNIFGSVLGIGASIAGAISLPTSALGGALGTFGSSAVGAAMVAGSAISTFGSTKGKVQRSGGFNANSGALGIMTPYFIISRPVSSIPATWQIDKGYPANISAQLSTILGYTEISEINLECSGTDAEKAEIISLLKNGVIF